MRTGRLLQNVTVTAAAPTREGVLSSSQPAGTTAADAPPPDRVWTDAAAHFNRWRAGESAALDDLVRLLTPVLWHVVRAHGLDRGSAEDAVQTTWLTLVRRHEAITDPQAVASWLTTTARREAWRQSRQQAKAAPTEDEGLEPAVPEQRSVEVEVMARDETERLWRCVGTLSYRCQRLLRIIAFSQRPDYAGVAAELQMPVGSIGPTRGRCLTKLRSALQRDLDGEVPGA